MHGYNVCVVGMFENQMQHIPDVLIEVPNKKGGIYDNPTNALRVFSCHEFGEDKQKQLFLEWTKNPTEEELHRLLTLIFHQRGKDDNASELRRRFGYMYK
jgi:hypothetical protein